MRIIPHGYQIRCAKHCLRHKRSALFLDMGLGKTVIVLTVISNLIQRGLISSALIIAPLRVVYNVWPTEIEKWDHLSELKLQIIHGKNKEAQLRSQSDVYVTNYESIPWLFDYVTQNETFQCLIDMIVFDESTAIKSSTTQRFKKLRLMMKRFDRRIILSGTPAPNSLLDLWSQYFLLDDGARLGSSKYWFQNAYFFQTDYQGYEWSPLPFASEDISKKVSDITIRLKAEDYLDMPKLIHNEIRWNMKPKIWKKYREFERNFLFDLDNEVVTAQNAAAKSTKLRQYVSGFVYDEEGKPIDVHSDKTDALVEIAEGNAGENMLVAIQFRYEYEIIKRKFPDAPVIYGGMSQSTTRALIKKWNEGSIPMLVVHPASIAHGINLQAGGRFLVWYGIPWSSEHYQQLLGRLYRQGQTKPVINSFIIAKDSIEERVVETLKTKGETEKSFLKKLIGDLTYVKKAKAA